MNRSIATRFFSIVLSATFTLAVLGGIDQLAQNDTGHADMAQASQPRA